MRMSSGVLLPLAMLLAEPARLSAQEMLGQGDLAVESGARVRLNSSTLPASQQVGRIISRTNDTIVFRSDRNPTTRSLAVSDISTIDLSLGQRRQTLRGAGIGLIAGAGIGAMLGALSYEPCSGWCIMAPSSQGEAAIFVGAVGGTLGLVSGTVLGFLNKSDRWHRVQPHTRLKVEPTSGGVGVSYKF